MLSTLTLITALNRTYYEEYRIYQACKVLLGAGSH